MFKQHVMSILFGVLLASSAVLAWLPSTFQGRERFSIRVDEQGQRTSPPDATIHDALRAIRALEARSLKHHQQLLEDTQALADAYNDLLQQNAERMAGIAELKKELEVIRAEVSALKTPRQ